MDDEDDLLTIFPTLAAAIATQHDGDQEAAAGRMPLAGTSPAVQENQAIRRARAFLLISEARTIRAAVVSARRQARTLRAQAWLGREACRSAASPALRTPLVAPAPRGPARDPLGSLLAHVPRVSTDVTPAFLRLSGSEDRPLVQLAYLRDLASRHGRAASFVALHDIATAAVESYELLNPHTPVLDRADLDTTSARTPGLRWIDAEHPLHRVLWPAAQTLVRAMTDRAGAVRAAEHLHCPLLEVDAHRR